MFFVIWGKIRNNKWLVASLLVGNIMLVAIISSIPSYSQAILQRIYVKTLEQSQVDSGMFPGLAQLHVLRLGMRAESNRQAEIYRVDEIVRRNLEQDFGVPVLMRTARTNTSSWRLTPRIERGDSKNLSMRLEGISGFKDAIELVGGSMFSNEVMPWVESEADIAAKAAAEALDEDASAALEGEEAAGNATTASQPQAGGLGLRSAEEDEAAPVRLLEVMVHEDLFMRSGFLLGEEFIIKSLRDPDDLPYAIRITGVFRPAPGTELYWGPAQYPMRSSLFVDFNLFTRLFLDEGEADSIAEFHWDTTLDYHSFQASDVLGLIEMSASYGEIAPSSYYRYNDYFTKTAESYIDKSRQLNLTLWVLVAPILVLLAFFVSMVSSQIIALDKNEISVLKSRGATSRQVFVLYLGMSMLLASVALLIGIPLGYAACGIIGSSNGFLEFVNRAGLAIIPNMESIWIASAAAAGIIIAMAIPAVRASRATIVAQKQKSMVKKRPFWRIVYLDILLLAFAIYELYIYSNQKELLAERAAAGAAVDPLLFISSSLFMLGAALLFVRLMSHLVRLVYILGRNVWPPSLYASLLRAIRASGDEQFIMVFLILTLATGVFDARVARTVNLNNEHSIKYEAGADIVIKEEWQINARHSVAEISDSGNVTYRDIVWHEPDFSRYQGLPGVESVTKVYQTSQGNVQSVRTQGGNMVIMGIISDEFGRTAWMRDGLLPSHINNYLNALAQNPDAVIVSSNFREKHNMKLGDRIMFTAENRSFMGVICGFVDYWPGYDPIYMRREYSGAVNVDDRYLVVANLAKMQRAQGVMPYEVWIRANGGDTGFIYNEISGGSLSGVIFTKFEDVRTKLVDAKNDPVFQGTNGILTIGFIAILLVCAVGFLIYWILSIRSRELQFGIFRAMGLGMRSVLSMLACEQILVSGMSILAGVGVGLLVSEHYVSLIQIGYSTGCRLPLISASDSLDTIRLFIVMSFMLISCMAVLGATVKRIRIAQALKLGEE